jgi:deoxyribodipyrimidine photo-lyase
MSQNQISILWVRRDFRLANNAALVAAVKRGAVVPVFIRDASVDALGSAPKLRLEMAIGAFAEALEGLGSRLILRSGTAAEVLETLAAETGASAVFWNRLYDPRSVARDTDVKALLKDREIEAQSFAGALLFEPWTVETKTGGPYRVYTPYWNAVRGRDVAPCLTPPLEMSTAEDWPQSEALAEWELSRGMFRGAAVVRRHVSAGEHAALERLDEFTDTLIAKYKVDRDRLDIAATSELSDALSLGEISPAQCWHAGRRAMQEGAAGAEHFLKEVVWREFAWHLLWHYPHMDRENWRPEWDGFVWNDDANHPHFMAWCRGITGQPVVDAAMRELYVTGKMHNRARMIVASYLTKHMRMHWRLGLQWFADCLVDWDLASNAMGWQWVAGSGPDAAPYFRIYNPETQAQKFDPKGTYLARWLPDAFGDHSDASMSFYDAVPKAWKAYITDAPAEPLVSLTEGRAVALAAYETYKTQ